MSDVNKEVIEVIKAIGDTPGFRLADAKSGNFKAVRNAMTVDTWHVEEATKSISIRAKDVSFENLMADLRNKLGWTWDLHNDLRDIAAEHRKAETDPTAAITERLLDAFLPDRNAAPEVPADETDEQRRERVRHARMASLTGSAKNRAGQTTPGGGMSAPIQLVKNAGEIRAEHISPMRALDLLCTIADYQRKLKPEKVRDFMRKMENGEWVLLASDPICIDWNGKLCNGQHRLEAVYQLEKGQEFYVAHDVDPATYDKMDRGTRRTTADMLYGKARAEGTLRKDVSSTALAAVLRVVHLWENVPQDEWNYEQRNVQETQIQAALAAHPNVADSVANGALRKLKIKPTASMFAHYMIAHRHDFDPEAVALLNDWYEEMRKPRRIRPGDPAFALREWFLGGEMDKVANRKTLPSKFHEQMLQAYLILRAWDNTCQGKSMLRLSWKPDFRIGTAARITDKINFPPNY